MSHTTVETGVISVAGLLCRDNLSIPPYQRPYKWTSRNIQQLFQDIQTRQGKGLYRLGTVVFHSNGNHLDIVDGQQRILTLILILKAITASKSLERADLKRQLDKVNENLDAVMDNWTFDNPISKQNLHQNYQEIHRIVRRSEFGESHIDFLLNHCELVEFFLDDVSAAFQFFDSQNARGRDLDPHDLLKAFHLREFPEHESDLKEESVAHWEAVESDELARLFGIYLYRIRRWSRGLSAREFGKKDIDLFKGVNIDKVDRFPYVEALRIAHHFVDDYNGQYKRKIDGARMRFPFHLDQILINGRRFFEMTGHYQKMVRSILENEYRGKMLSAVEKEQGYAGKILETINSYGQRHRTGDLYVRSIFDCLMIYYIDKFGTTELPNAIEKAFIWAYALRIRHYAVKLATIDNHVLENNAFIVIRETVEPGDFLTMSLPTLSDRENRNNSRKGDVKSDPIVKLFREMGYYE